MARREKIQKENIIHYAELFIAKDKTMSNTNSVLGGGN